jgi:predicted O-methyltransferase YrrM
MIGVDLWEVQTGTLQSYDYRDNNEYEVYVREQAKKFGPRAIVIKGYTNDAALQVEDNSLDFVFIDADHSSECVREDIIKWSPKVKDTGWICGHDINWPTVRSVVDDLVPGYVIGPDNVWARKKV